MYDGFVSNSLTRHYAVYTTRSLGLSVRGVMVGRESLPDFDLEDSLRLVVAVVVVDGAPSWASFLAAPLGPDSREEVADLSALDDEEDVVDEEEDDEDDDDATSATSTSATSSTTTVSSLALSAGLEDGFHVGL